MTTRLSDPADGSVHALDAGRTEFQCPAGDSFGTIEYPAGTVLDTVFHVKRCRNSRCAEPGRIVFHRFEALTGHCKTFTHPYRTAADLRRIVKES